MSDNLPYHVRGLDSDGNTIRQSTVAYPTVEAARAAAKRMDRIHGDDHYVCESLTPDDPRNTKKAGWCRYVEPAPIA